MTTLLNAEKDLLAEVRSRITALVPERQATIRFRHRSEEAQKHKRFENADRKARMFEVGAGDIGELLHVGNDSRGFFTRYPIRIMYPFGSEHWQGAANSDVERINHDLLNNATTVSGVQNRRIDPASIPERIEDPDDDWTELRLVLRVHYDISGT